MKLWSNLILKEDSYMIIYTVYCMLRSDMLWISLRSFYRLEVQIILLTLFWNTTMQLCK